LSKFKKTSLYLYYKQKNMIIVKVKNEKSIEQALKSYKFKINKTKQTQKLQERKEYKKPSVLRRAEIKKAEYNQKNQLDS
jgi:small subunit ribosomal protein S21